MVRGKRNHPQEILSKSELESITEEKRELEVALAEVEGGAGAGTQRAGAVDVGKIKREIKHLDDVIQERTAPKLRGTDKDDMAKEEKQLEDEMADGMPTQWEMRKPSLNPGAVRKHMQWGLRNQARIQRYVQIQKMLRPEEPKSIENLRREK